MSYVVIRQPEGVSTITVQMGGAGEGSATSAVETVNNIDPVSGNVTLTAADVGAVATGDLAPVATSGDYDDLTGKPTIPSTPGDIGAATAAQGALADSAVQAGDLAPVATSGAYTDLTGKPTIPTTPGEVGADAAGAAAVVASDLSDHEVLTTGAHGGIVAEGDPRLTDDRDPTQHGSSHDWNGTDPVAVPARPVVYYSESDVVLRDWAGSGPERVLNIPSPAPVIYVPVDPTVALINAVAVGHDPSDPDYRFPWSIVLPAPVGGVGQVSVVDDGPGVSAAFYGIGYTYAVDPGNGLPPVVQADFVAVDGIDLGFGSQWAWVQPDIMTALLGSRLDALGAAASLGVGTTAGTVAAGDDARFSDDRTPTAHAASHGSAGSDAVTPAAIGAAETSHTHAGADITSGTVAAARLGSGTANSTTYLRGDQTWATVAGGGAAGPPAIPYISGEYRGLAGASKSSAFAALTSTGLLAAQPLWMEAGVYKRIGVITTAVGTATYRFGVYPMDPVTMSPAGQSLIVDCGTLSMAATPGLLEITTTITIPTSGIYYLAILVDAYTSSPTIHGYAGDVGALPMLPLKGVRVPTNPAGRGQWAALRYGVTTGAMPASFPVPTLWGDQMPLIYVRCN